MAMSLRTYLNNQIKAKGSSLAKEKAKAGKYKSIAAAKKAGALYYTNKDGKVMAAVYAEDLKKAKPKVKPIPRPKPRPKKEKLGAGERPKVTVKTLEKTGSGRGDNKNEVLIRRAEIAISAGSKSKRIAQLKAEQRKLRTKIANARQKGKDDKAASARIKQLTTMINKLK
tara:strand:- start:669 stop:1178 length:510 start_codon:yes stop_codon:yes gene_type:complete